MNNKRGFTLIELLIVVAIIAILAAIAIPNFLQAQVRSKVSRVKSEFQTIATAIEAYNVDNDTYPVYHNTVYPQDGVFGDDVYGSYHTYILTTPISYISSYPNDPFAINDASTGLGLGYFFYTWNETQNTPFTAPIGFADHWATRSRGPNLIWDFADANENATPWDSEAAYGDDVGLLIVTYDPSNGTVSNGDIWRDNLSGQID